jgi:hypothetical protein
MQLTAIKGDLIIEDARFLKDNTYVRDVTLESVMDCRNIFESLHINKKAALKGSVMLVATTPPKGKVFPKQFKKSCSLCGKQRHNSVDCFSRPENAHKKPGFMSNEKALTTTAPTSKSSLTCTYCQKPDHKEKRCYKKKNDEGISNDKVAVMFMVT